MIHEQKIFTQLEENKAKLSDIKKEFLLLYRNVNGFEDFEMERRELNSKMRDIKIQVHAIHQNLFLQMEDLKIDIASDKEMLNDIILSKLMKGESVTVENKFNQEMLPLFSVNMKQQ